MVDISKAVSTDNKKEAYKCSGLEIIANIIEKEVGELADAVFIEYNLLASVLESNSKEGLSMSFLL